MLENQTKHSTFNGIRGWAVLLMLIYSMIPYQLPGGFLVYDVFFILIGYTTTHYVMNELMNKGKVSFVPYVKKRLTMLLVPTLWAIAWISFLAIVFNHNMLLYFKELTASSVLFVNNLWQLMRPISFFEQTIIESPFQHFWVASIAMQFIVIWPFVFTLCSSVLKKRNQLIQALLLLTIGSAVWSVVAYMLTQSPSRVYYGTDTHVYPFLMGATASLIIPPENFSTSLSKQQKRSVSIILWSSLLLMMVALNVLSSQLPIAYLGGGILVSGLFTVCFIAASYQAAYGYRFFNHDIVQWIGRRYISYYIWGYPVLVMYQSIVKPTTQALLHTGSALFIIMVISEISYQVFTLKRFGNQTIFRRFKTDMHVFLKEKRLSLLQTVRSSILIGLPVCCFVAILLSTFTKNDSFIQLTTTLSQNTQLVKATQDDKTTTPTVTINNISGLSREEGVYASALNITFLGDSTLLAAAHEIEAIFPNAVIDAAMNRQLYQSSIFARELMNRSLMKEVVVIVLGANSSATLQQIEHLILTIGVDKQIFFVTTTTQHAWQSDTNEKMLTMSKKYSNVHIIDWNAYATTHSEWFYADRTHTNEQGSAEWIRYLAKQLYATLKTN